MTTTERKTGETTQPDASIATERKPHLGLVAAGAVVVLGLGAGLTALILGVTGDTRHRGPGPGRSPVRRGAIRRQ